ncbi:MAG: DUF4339 domain-containing protein [Myxococcales bacterium]|nr:DUF4339 domain-containing protein [Myxococcales bacterium]
MQQGKHAWIAQDGPTSMDLRCRWYIARSGKTDGPYAYDELVSMARQGRLTASHYVWRPGFEQWITVYSRSDLHRELPPRPTLGVVPLLENAYQQHTTDVRLSRDLLDEVPATSLRDHISRETELPDVDASSPGFSMHVIPEMNLSVWRASLSSDVAYVRAGLLAAVGLGDHASLEEEDPSMVQTVLMQSSTMVMSVDEEPAESVENEAYEEPHPLRLPSRGILRPALIIGGAVFIASYLATELWDKLTVRPSNPPAKEKWMQPEDIRSGPMTPLPHVAPSSEGNTSSAVTPLVVPKKRLTKKSAGVAISFQRPPASSVSVAPANPGLSRGADDFSWLNGHRSARAVPVPKTVRARAMKTKDGWRKGAAKKAQTVHRFAPYPFPSTLSDEAAGRVVASHFRSLVRCAQVDRRNDSLPEGVEIGLLVSGPGEVTNTSIRGVSRSVAQCVRRRSKGWTFPAVASASKVKVRIGRGGTVRTYVHRHLRAFRREPG